MNSQDEPPPPTQKCPPAPAGRMAMPQASTMSGRVNLALKLADEAARLACSNRFCAEVTEPTPPLPLPAPPPPQALNMAAELPARTKLRLFIIRPSGCYGIDGWQ